MCIRDRYWNPWWGWGGAWGPGYGYYAPWPGYNSGYNYYPPANNTVAPYPAPYGPGDSGNGDDNASPNSYAYPDPGANDDTPNMIPANSIEAAPLQDTNSPNASPTPTTSPAPATSPATTASPATKPISPAPQTRPRVQTASDDQAM